MYIKLDDGWGTLTTLYSYQVFLIHTAVWGHKDVTPSWYICLVSLTHNGGSRRTFTWVLTCNMSYVMIETPLTLHTYRRSYLYIYKDFQHLPLWLMVTRMQPHTDICLVSSPSGGRWLEEVHSLGFSLVSCRMLWCSHPIQFILIEVLLHTYIKCFSTCCCG